MYDQYHLRSSIKSAMHKIKSGKIIAGSIKTIFKETIERFVASDNSFSFMNSVKETPTYWKQFLYDTVAMVKQIGIPTNFPTLSCADIRRKKLP